MKGIYVTDGIKIDVYSENAFDEVAKSFCVYMVAVERFRRRQYSRLPNLQGKSKKVRVIGSSKKIAGSKEKKPVFSTQ